jgi:uncharacterized protein
MMRRITITVGDIVLDATLNDSPTADEIWDALPLEASANVWGDEIYFEIPVEVDQASNARAGVEIGTLAYWPMGHAFCIFYGRTPASRGNQPRAYSPVNVFGEVKGDATRLRGVTTGTRVRVDRAG